MLRLSLRLSLRLLSLLRLRLLSLLRLRLRLLSLLLRERVGHDLRGLARSPALLLLGLLLRSGLGGVSPAERRRERAGLLLLLLLLLRESTGLRSRLLRESTGLRPSLRLLLRKTAGRRVLLREAAGCGTVLPVLGST
ncbi:hypothetical protein AB0I53_00185 [Saccharopolyspora sp. NPDC050389]|uniref:hypothetical protein n=1 Tax=Saccharopolyspora sp. NPDC050389 TaxID=3155516 RepID=UPI0033E5F9F8